MSILAIVLMSRNDKMKLSQRKKKGKVYNRIWITDYNDTVWEKLDWWFQSNWRVESKHGERSKLKRWNKYIYIDILWQHRRTGGIFG